MLPVKDIITKNNTIIKNICNCGTGTIGGIESGKAKPSFEMMIKISEAQNIKPFDPKENLVYYYFIIVKRFTTPN